jgi:Zn finger protein HypA/HybF involved in hydrogenase expression
METKIKDNPTVLICYECDAEVKWLAPDGRCSKCTRMTVNEIVGEEL